MEKIYTIIIPYHFVIPNP